MKEEASYYLVTAFEVSLLAFLHIASAIIWVGAHFFEAFILHISLAKVAPETRYGVYSRLLFRFNKVTGLAAVGAIYLGVALASARGLGSLAPLVTTPWGLATNAFAIALLAGLLAPLPPKSITRLFNTGLIAAVLAVIAAIASAVLGLELGPVAASSWGRSIIAGGVLAVALLGIGASQGLKRVEIAILSSQVLAREGGDEAPKRLEALEHRMLRMVIPENVIALVVLVLMVYAVRPF